MRSPDPVRRFLWCLVAAAALWTAFEIAWFATGTPDGPIAAAPLLNQLVAGRQPQGENGWELLAGAGRAAGEVWREQAMQHASQVEAGPAGPPAPRSLTSRPDFDQVHGPGPLPEDLSWELEAIEAMRTRGAFDDLAAAAACPRFARLLPAIEGRSLFHSSMHDDVGGLRSLARVRRFMMAVAAARGDHAEMVRAFDELLAMSRAAGAQAFLIDRMVAYAIGRLALEEAARHVQGGALDEATCRGLLAAIERRLPLPPVDLTLEECRLGSLELTRQAFTDDRHGSGRASLGGDLRHGMLEGGFVLASRDGVERAVNEFCDGMARNARLTPVERLRGGFDEQAFRAGLSLRHKFVGIMLPNLSNYLDQDIEFHRQAQATRTAIALAAYRARHGEFPDRLEALVPDVLEALPRDPTHGGSFVYRRLDGPLPYVLYSTGADETDDTAGVSDPVTSATFGPSMWTGGTDVLLFVPQGPVPAQPAAYPGRRGRS